MWTGSIEDFGSDAQGGPWLECWECAGEFRYLHEATEHERISGHGVIPRTASLNTPAGALPASITEPFASNGTAHTCRSSGFGDVAAMSWTPPEEAEAAV